MNQRRVLMVLALSFSLIFMLVYYLLFQMLFNEKRVSFIQVGIYEKQENVEKQQKELSALGISTYVWKDHERFVIGCGMENIHSVEKKLEDADMKFVKKTIRLNQTHWQLWKQKQYIKVLEGIVEYESKTDGGKSKT